MTGLAVAGRLPWPDWEHVVKVMDETWARQPPLSPAQSARWYAQLRDRFSRAELVAAVEAHGLLSDRAPSLAVLDAGAWRYRTERALQRAREDLADRDGKLLADSAPDPSIPRELRTALRLGEQRDPVCNQQDRRGRWGPPQPTDQHDFELLARHHDAQLHRVDGVLAPKIGAEQGCPVCRLFVEEDERAAAAAPPPPPKPWADVEDAEPVAGVLAAAVEGDAEATP